MCAPVVNASFVDDASRASQSSRPLQRIGHTVGTMTVIPHANWRGIFETVTFANGGIQFCGSGCINAYEIPFTGLNVSGWLEPLHTTTPKHWFGSLLTSQRDASGLLYRRNRMYDPKTGRFTQEDPIGLAGGMNLYGFGGGDPVTYGDPFGLAMCPFSRDPARHSSDTSDCTAEEWSRVTGVVHDEGIGPIQWLLDVGPLVKGFGLARSVVRGLAARAVARRAATEAADELFVHGRTVQRAFETSKGIVDFQYTAQIEGKTLTLNRLSIFHRFEEEVTIGHAEVRKFLQQIANEAKEAGFERLNLSGVRIKNRRIAEISIDLTQ